MIEWDLIGCAMQDPRIVTASRVRPQHFDDGTLGQVWAELGRMAESGTQPTPPLVAAALQMPEERARLLCNGLVDATLRVVPANHERHAQAVLEAAERRTLRDAAVRVQAMLDAGQPVEDVRQQIAKHAGPDGDDDELANETLSLDEFVDQALPDEQWLIPDMLAAGDRLILTGGEGSGKSILLRQIACCVAAGCHPFRRERIRPSRVLYVDAENPLRIMVQKIRPIRDALRLAGFESQDRMFINRQPGGLDLTSVKGRTMLRHMCRVFNPDLLVIGPIYKLYVQSSEKDEVPARQIAALIDELRQEHNLAVLTEHHTPMQQLGHARQIRPVGTGLWQRWPEFGFGIVPQQGTVLEDRQMDLVPWRGSRDERAWPKRLQGSGGAPGRLPWVDMDCIGSAWR